MTMTSSSVSLRYRSALGQLLRHRRSWIRARLVSLAGLFGVAVPAFAVLSNHLHVILRIRPDVVALWSDQEVARRWLALFPGRVRSQTASAVAAPGRLSRASGQVRGPRVVVLGLRIHVRRDVGACCVRYAEVTGPSEAPPRAYSGFLFQCYSRPGSEDARFIDEQLGLLVRASYQGQGVPVRD